jgi:thiol-disulfide isomerase/thioredoxin
MSLGLGAAVAVPASARAAEAGDALDLAKYRGKVVYVDFWASWCAPCRLSFAYLSQLRASYDGKDLVIVTVNLDRDRKAAANFLQAVGTGLPVVYDPKGALATRFQVSTMPTSVLIGRDGRTRFVHHGYFDNKTGEYSEHVSTLVAEHG